MYFLGSSNFFLLFILQKVVYTEPDVGVHIRQSSVLITFFKFKTGKAAVALQLVSGINTGKYP